jgi:hypothetical protein
MYSESPAASGSQEICDRLARFARLALFGGVYGIGRLGEELVKEIGRKRNPEWG